MSINVSNDQINNLSNLTDELCLTAFFFLTTKKGKSQLLQRNVFAVLFVHEVTWSLTT